MPSGLFALLDDVATITKVAAASLDDVAAAAGKAGAKAAGVVIDDAAVTPRYVTGFTPQRELPIIWKIAKGSLKNKLLFILPAALLLSANTLRIPFSRAIFWACSTNSIPYPLPSWACFTYKHATSAQPSSGYSCKATQPTTLSSMAMT